MLTVNVQKYDCYLMYTELTRNSTCIALVNRWV